jgi:lipopolysaccharide transport system ATP-binding protein
MYVRLAFAIAVHLEPEVLIMDEVLAVGDAAFQQKCHLKMKDVGREGRTVFYVSHDLSSVRQLCGRVLLIEAGRLQEQGRAETVIANYLSRVLPAADA